MYEGIRPELRAALTVIDGYRRTKYGDTDYSTETCASAGREMRLAQQREGMIMAEHCLSWPSNRPKQRDVATLHDE